MTIDNAISVVIPTIGRKSFYERALPSVLAQEENWTELIVVVDNAEQVEIVRDYISKLECRSKIRIIEGRRKGGLSARLLGGKYASGEHIVFLDDDDELGSDYLMQLINIVGQIDTGDKIVYLPTTKRIWCGVKADFILNFVELFRSGKPYEYQKKIFPHTFTGIYCSKSVLTDFTIEPILAFQDVLFIHNIRERGVNIYHKQQLNVLFYQDIGAARNTNNLSCRVSCLEHLYSNRVFDTETIEAIKISSYFSYLRYEAASSRNFSLVFRLICDNYKMLIRNNYTRFIAELGLLIFIIVFKRRVDK